MFARKMIYVALALSLALGGCSTASGVAGIGAALATGSVPNVPPKAVAELRLTYDVAFLPAAVAYKRLPRCASGTHWTFALKCKEVAYVRRIQKADRAAEIALESLERISLAGDTLTFGVAYTAASSAVHDAIALVDVFKSK